MGDSHEPYKIARRTLAQIEEILRDEVQQRSDARINALNNRIAELEELLGLSEEVDIPVVQCRSKRRVQTVMKLLAARELVSTTAVILAIGGDELSDTTAKVYIHYARASLKPFNVKVCCEAGRGWYVAAADRPRLRAILRGELTSRKVSE